MSYRNTLQVGRFQDTVLIVDEIFFDADNGVSLKISSGNLDIVVDTQVVGLLSANAAGTISGDLTLSGNLYGDGNTIEFQNVDDIAMDVLELGTGFSTDIPVLGNLESETHSNITGDANVTDLNIEGNLLSLSGTLTNLTVTGNLSASGNMLALLATVNASDITVSNLATFSGESNIGQNIIFTGSTSLDEINVITGNLDVIGTTTASSIEPSNLLVVTGLTTIHGNLTVSGGDVSAVSLYVGDYMDTYDFEVTGATVASGTVSLAGNATLSGLLTTAGLFISDSLSVSGTLDVQALRTGGNLSVTGNTSSTGTISTTGTANLTDVDVAGNAETAANISFGSFSGTSMNVVSNISVSNLLVETSIPSLSNITGTGNYIVSGATSFVDLAVSGNLSAPLLTAAAASVTGLSQHGPVPLSGNVSVSGDTTSYTINEAGDFTVTGESSTQTTTVGSGSGNLVSTGLSKFANLTMDTETAILSGDASITDFITLEGGNLVVSGGSGNFVSIAGNLECSGTLGAASLTTTGNALMVDVSVTAGTSALANMSVSGDGNIDAVFTVSGTSNSAATTTTIGGTTNDLGIIDSSGAATVSTSFSGSNINLDGTLSVITGNITSATLDTSATSIIGGTTLSVSTLTSPGQVSIGEFMMGGTMTSNNSLDLRGAGNVYGNFASGDPTQILGNLEAEANIIDFANFDGAASANIGGTLDSVTGTIGTFSLTGNLDVDGNAAFGAITFQGDTTFTGNLSVTGDINGGNLGVGTDTDVDELSLTGNATISGDTATVDLFANSDVKFSGTIAAPTMPPGSFKAYLATSYSSSGTSGVLPLDTEVYNTTSTALSSGNATVDFDGLYEVMGLGYYSGFSTTLKYRFLSFSINGGGLYSVELKYMDSDYGLSYEVMSHTSVLYLTAGDKIGLLRSVAETTQFYSSNVELTTRFMIQPIQTQRYAFFARYELGSPQTLLGTTETKVLIDTVHYDSLGPGGSLTSNEIYVPRDGYYDVGFSFLADTSTAGEQYGYIQITAPDTSTSTAAFVTTAVRDINEHASNSYEIVYLEKGSKISLYASLSTGADLDFACLYVCERSAPLAGGRPDYLKLRQTGEVFSTTPGSEEYIPMNDLEYQCGRITSSGSDEYITIDVAGVYSVGINTVFDANSFDGPPETCGVAIRINDVDKDRKFISESNDGFGYITVRGLFALFPGDTVKFAAYWSDATPSNVGYSTSTANYHRPGLYAARIAAL